MDANVLGLLNDLLGRDLLFTQPFFKGYLPFSRSSDDLVGLDCCVRLFGNWTFIVIRIDVFLERLLNSWNLLRLWTLRST